MKRLSLSIAIASILLASAACTRDPVVQAQNHLKYGNRMFDLGKYKEASIMYRRALQKNPRFGEAYYRLGLTDIKLSAYGEAVRALQRAVELEPNNADASGRLADIYLAAYTSDTRNRKPILKEVQDLRDTLLKRNPKSYDGLRLSGYIALANNDLAGAIKNFEAANDVKAFQPDLTLALVQALIADNRFPEAEQLARQTIARQKTYAPLYDALYVYYIKHNQAADAEKILLEKVANNPKQAEYLLQLAGHYYAAQRPADAQATLQRVLADPKEFPMGHAMVGDFYFRTRNFDGASQQYREGIEAAGKDKGLYQKRMVQVLLVRDKKTDAAQLVNAILKDNPKDAEAIEMRSALQLQTGNPQQVQMAIDNLQSLVQKSPDSPALRFNLGRAFLAKGDRDQAVLQLQEAIKLRPDFVPAKVVLAQILLNKGEFAKSGAQIEEALRYEPANLQAHLIHASDLLGMGQKEKARTELQAIVKAYPNSDDARYQLGYLSYLEKDYKTAEATFEQLHQKSPGDARGLVGVVEAEVGEGRYKNAVQIMESEIQKEPNRNDFKLALANIEARGEQYDDAIKIYRELIAKNPKSGDLYYKVAEAYRLKGDVNQAIENFRQSSALSPNSPAPLLNLALLLDGTGRRDQATPVYEQVLKLDPDNPIALNNVAYMKADEGADLDQALTMAQRAKRKAPSDVNVSDTLGWVYLKKNLNDNAVGIFRDLTVQRPSNPTFHYHLGMALYQKGDKAGAKKELGVALQDKPSKDEQSKIHDLMAKIG
ncbi:MAG: tetratricopeptide repeat protein [Bryobacteraceae bacterium]